MRFNYKFFEDCMLIALISQSLFIIIQFFPTIKYSLILVFIPTIIFSILSIMYILIGRIKKWS